MKRLIYILLAFFTLCLAGCDKDPIDIEPVEIEMAFTQDSSNIGYSLGDNGVYNNFYGIPEDWGSVVPFNFGTDIDVDLKPWEDWFFQYAGVNSGFLLAVEIINVVTGGITWIFGAIRMDQERRALAHLNEAVRLLTELNNNHLKELMKNLEDLNTKVNTYLDSIQLATEDMMIEQQVLSQYYRINYIMDAINKQQTFMREFVNVDFVYYHDAIELILAHQSDSVRKHISFEDEYAYRRTIYSMLDDWAGTGNKRIMDILALGDQMCHTTYTSEEGTLTGMPALYDQLMRDLKPWEHEAVESAANLRLPDLELYTECVLLAAEYLAACDALQQKAHGIDPNILLSKLETTARQVIAAYQPPTYNDKIRVCNIAGAHLIFRDLYMTPINYTGMRWIPSNFFVYDVLAPYTITYGFTGQTQYIYDHQIPERKAERIMRYYADSDMSLPQILVENGDMYPSTKEDLENANLLLAGTPDSTGGFLYAPAAGKKVAPVAIAEFTLTKEKYFNRQLGFKVPPFYYVNVQ